MSSAPAPATTKRQSGPTRAGKWTPARWMGVRKSERGFRWALANELRQYAISSLPRGRGRRSWKHKAMDLVHCCAGVRARQCRACGTLDCTHASVIASCDLRTCPGCARRRADVFRKRLDRAIAKGVHREFSLYMLTLTLRYDPNSPTSGDVADLAARRDRVLDGWRWIWRDELKSRTIVHGERLGGAACSLEVSHRGAVHAHVLFLGRRFDYSTVNASYQARLGGAGEGYVDVRRVKGNPRKAVNEMAKYLLKSTSPKRALRGEIGEYPDPKLAARVEVAFAGARLFQCYGGWRGITDEGDELPDEPPSCDGCGLVDAWIRVTMTREEWLRIASGAWLPTFQRAGPPAEVAARRARSMGIAGPN